MKSSKTKLFGKPLQNVLMASRSWPQIVSMVPMFEAKLFGSPELPRVTVVTSASVIGRSLQ